VVICGRKATGSYLLRGSNFLFLGLECVKIKRTCGCVCNTALCSVSSFQRAHAEEAEAYSLNARLPVNKCRLQPRARCASLPRDAFYQGTCLNNCSQRLRGLKLEQPTDLLTHLCRWQWPSSCEARTVAASGLSSP